MAMRSASDKQQKLYALLREYAANGRTLSLDRILSATGYKDTAIKPMISKGLVPWLHKTAKDSYTVQGFSGITLERFQEALSQRKNGPPRPVTRHMGVFGDLLEAAAQEFQLAIELFNRPTTPNRVDAFVVHFCAAWEKMLKARLVKEHGEATIWENGKERKSKSLRKVLADVYPVQDPVRLNVEYILDLRDETMHYVLPELGPIASRYFQSGVMNFFREYLALAGYPPMQVSGVGLLSLVFDGTEPYQATLVQRYGHERAAFILSRIQRLEQAADQAGDNRFAIPLHLSIGFVDKRSQPEQTIAGIAGVMPIVVNKPIDPKTSHPLEAKQVVAEVNKRLKSRFNEDALRKLLGRAQPEFNIHDFSSISSMEGWKDSSNKYHFDHGTIVRHTYSDACIDFIMEKLAKDGEYLKRAKKREVEKRKKRRNG
jgi:hypothetical protein